MRKTIIIAIIAVLLSASLVFGLHGNGAHEGTAKPTTPTSPAAQPTEQLPATGEKVSTATTALETALKAEKEAEDAYFSAAFGDDTDKIDQTEKAYDKAKEDVRIAREELTKAQKEETTIPGEDETARVMEETVDFGPSTALPASAKSVSEGVFYDPEINKLLREDGTIITDPDEINEISSDPEVQENILTISREYVSVDRPLDPDADIAAMQEAADKLKARKAAKPKLTYDQAFEQLTSARDGVSKAKTELAAAELAFGEAEATNDPDKIGEATDKYLASQEKVKAAEEKEKAAAATLSEIRSLGDFVGYYQNYAGLAGWTSLIWDDSKALQKWRDKVNEAFCQALGWAPLSKECWTSEVCGRYSDITPSRDGVLFSTPVGGAPRAVAHIEARRSLPIEAGKEKSWIYTVTFGLSNPTEKTMNYNVQFRSAGYTPNWWSEQQILAEGGIVSALGASALIKHSDKNYGEVCLVFNPKIKAFDGKQIGKVCNSVVQASGTPSSPYAEDEVEDAKEESPEIDTTAPDTPGASV